tara:strand:+ start:167 stop:316 length:150 start_codon:yes stop_codon:yes gene_type:complete
VAVEAVVELLDLVTLLVEAVLVVIDQQVMDHVHYEDQRFQFVVLHLMQL